MTGSSSLVVEKPTRRFRARLLADGQPHLGRDAFLPAVGRGWAAHLRANPSGIDRVREDVRPEAGDGGGQHEIAQVRVCVTLRSVPAALAALLEAQHRLAVSKS